MRTDELPDFRRTPTTSELRAILETYFSGAITDEQVKTVELLLRDIMESQPKHTSESNRFYSNSQVWKGRLFLEEDEVPRAPRVVDMACIVAVRVLGMQRARPYCPEPIAGVWEDAGNPAIRWQLGADGAFHTDQPEYKEATRWYVIRRGGSAGDIVHLVEPWDEEKTLRVDRASPTELVLEYMSNLDRKHTLRRAR